MDCGFLKTPEPMTVPTTRAVVANQPRTRGRAEGAGGGDDAVFMATSLRQSAKESLIFSSHPSDSWTELLSKDGATGELVLACNAGLSTLWRLVGLSRLRSTKGRSIVEDCAARGAHAALFFEQVRPG